MVGGFAGRALTQLMYDVGGVVRGVNFGVGSDGSSRQSEEAGLCCHDRQIQVLAPSSRLSAQVYLVY